MALLDRLGDYALLMRLDRPIGALLLLWPMLWALWLAAGGVPDPLVLGVFLAGVMVMRSAGCVINDYADRDFDPHVERTRTPAIGVPVSLTITPSTLPPRATSRSQVAVSPETTFALVGATGLSRCFSRGRTRRSSLGDATVSV